MEIRLATLDDVAAICDLFQGQIGRWQRLNAEGIAEDVSYADLTVYERWLHGGSAAPWMSLETASIWLSHLRRGGGMPRVMLNSGGIVAYAEVFAGDEPAPYGQHMYLGQLISRDAESGRAMFQKLREEAAGQASLFTATCAAYDSDCVTFYARSGLAQLVKSYRVQFAAQQGQGFYQVTPHKNPAAVQITGWYMPLGERGSGREQWERLWPSHWDALPKLAERAVHRLRFSAAGQEAFVYFARDLYDPRSAHVSCWTPKPISAQMIIAMRDWAYRQGYRTLQTYTDEKLAHQLTDDIGAAQRFVYAQTL